MMLRSSSDRQTALGALPGSSWSVKNALASHALSFRIVSEIQLAALDLYQRGFNVFALERGKKETSFHWGKLQTTRLIDPDANDPKVRTLSREMFFGVFHQANAAVITGRTSRNLTVLDCENVQSATFHRQEFERRGWHPWVVRTARGFHFWFLSHDGTLANIDSKHNSGEWELRAHDKYVLVPPSIHPSGVIYEWVEREGDLPPHIPLTALDWFGASLHLKRRPKPSVPQLFPDVLSKLSQSNRAFCTDGAPRSQRNRRLFAAACDFAGNRISIDDAHPHLLQGCEKSGYDRSFTPREVERTIESAFRKRRVSAKTYYKASETLESAPIYQHALSFVGSHPWTQLSAIYNGTRIRVTADAARRVMQACCERARQDDIRDLKRPFRAASREIAELADVDRRTASKVLFCLVANEYLVRHAPNEHKANQFAFGARIAHKGTNSRAWYKHTGTLVRNDAVRDAFTRGALSNSTESVWKAILEEPLKVSQIAKRTNLKPYTVRRGLSKLAKHELARRIGKGYWLGDTTDHERLRQIANAHGTLGKTQKRREKHIRERQLDATEQLLRWRYGKRWAAHLRLACARDELSDNACATDNEKLECPSESGTNG